MEYQTVLKLELDIAATKMLQRVIINNEGIESQIQKGIELAVKDLTDGDAFVQKVRETTKQQIDTLVNRALMSYEIQRSIEKSISSKLQAKIEEYSNELAENLFQALKTK